MAYRDELGIRMKEYYEQIPKTRLMRRTPVIIRLDGKAFHTFTKGFAKPFDEVMVKTMQETTKYLCENIQGCVLGYCQSDEITLVLVDYQTLDAEAWFDYEVQKICSISASMATMAFNRFFASNAGDEERYQKKLGTAMFDSRAFNIPREEVTNCIYWRQLDASRNSVQMLGQAHFKHKELQGKSCSEIQDRLMLEKGINWNNLPTCQKRGTCVVRKQVFIPKSNLSERFQGELCKEGDTYGVYRECWVIDTEIPIFKGDGREYIERLVQVGEV